jgi:type IV secretion system protein VirB4
MLTGLVVGVAVTGLVLCFLLWLQVREVSQVSSLKRHRSKQAGLADLLNYAAVVEDGVVICKNGGLLAAWSYQGADNESSTHDEREVVSFRINQIVSQLGNGWMWHVDALRSPAPAYSAPESSHFPDPVTKAIDEERRRAFEAHGNLFEGQFVLIVTYLPPAAAVRKFGSLMFSDDRPEATDSEAAKGILERFKREVDALENRLSSVFRLRRLKARNGYDEFLAHLQRCIAGKDHPVRLPKNPMHLDAVLGGQELYGGVLPKIGKRYVQCVAIDGFPTESYPGMLTALGELGIDYRWSSRFIFLDSWEAINHLERFRKRWKQMVVPFIAQVLRLPASNLNEDARAMEQDATQAKVSISGGLVSAGFSTSVVVLMGEDRSQVEADASSVEKAINRLGFGARIETINTLDAFFGSLPGHGKENVRRPLLHTLNLADFLPVSSIWTGEASCPCPFYHPNSPPLFYAVTTGNTPFRGNVHVRDTGHGLVFGPIGSGKSTLLAFLAASFRRYPGMTLYCFDKGMSMYALCKAAGGTHYTIAGEDDRLAFCPLQYLETRSDRAWAVEWIDQILSLNGKPATPAQRNDIARSLDILAHQGQHRTLTAFCNTIQDTSVRQVLHDYTVAGGMGVLFDAERDALSGFGSFTVFEIEDLMNLGERYALPILWYLFRRIERSLHGQPAAILLDEAWLMLGHAVFREKIREWLKVMRKANCAVILATQSLSDAARSGILDVLDESCPTKVFLPNASARADDAAALYRRFGLNEREIEIIAGAIPKREYYFTSEKGRRLINLELGPMALAFLGVSDKDSVAEVQRCEAEYGDGWVDEWLVRKGLAPMGNGIEVKKSQERLALV